MGKGVTYDSGGISLKTDSQQIGEKKDMCGAAAVAAAMKTAALQKLPLNLIAVLPLVENMPNGNAYKPDDILTSFSGQTVEVVDTDGEGRLILADALWLAQEKYKVKTLVDMATLTGSTAYIFGGFYAALLGNDTALLAQVKEAAAQSGEKVWELPLEAEIDKRLKSETADMKNVGKREADIIISSTASPLPIIGKGMVERALKSRRNQPMLLVDIAVPRDVEPEVGKLANAYLYSVDDLQSIISHNLAQRKAAAVEAETIVAQETSEFMAWLRAQSASETIREYRSQAEHVRDELTAKALAALEQGGDAQAIMQDLAWKLTNRLIHAPTKSLQQAARDGDNERLNILRDSLGLE